MKLETRQAIIAELVSALRKRGLRVFLSKSKDYGFFTDEDGLSVVSFSTDFCGVKFCGNYVSTNPRSDGQGWVMDVTGKSYYDMLKVGPHFSTSGRIRLKSLERYMAEYGPSSGFAEVTNY